MPSEPTSPAPALAGAAPTAIDRREAIRRVTTLLGGVALVGGSGLLAACERARAPGSDSARAAAPGSYRPVGAFTVEEIATLDEVADTILPTTARSPGAKAAAVGPFMALMVTDGYGPREQRHFRDGLRALDQRSRAAGGAAFAAATPAQRLAVLQALDREQFEQARAREAALAAAARQAPRGDPTPDTPRQAAAKEAAGRKADALLPDARGQNAENPEVGAGAAVPASEGAAGAGPDGGADAPLPHWFRMMKELALLGYFTSEIGYTKAMRYVESPGRFDPCAPYAQGEPAWAAHA